MAALCIVEVESMSQTISASSHKAYGVARVVTIWNLARSSFYAARSRERNPRQPLKHGPKVVPNAELLAGNPPASETRRRSRVKVTARSGSGCATNASDLEGARPSLAA
jgi:hypothetical protein